MVLKAGKCFGRPFNMERGVTQGDLVSQIFNIVVNAVVREFLLEVCGPQEAHHGFRWAAGEHNTRFYVDDGRIAGYNPIWSQKALTAMLRIFEKVGL